MSERRSTPALLFVLLVVFSSTTPLLLSVAAGGADETDTTPAYNAGGVIIGDLEEFNPSEGSEYLFIHEDEPVVSATQFMRQAWIDAGRPGVDQMVIEPSMGRSSGRACTPPRCERRPHRAGWRLHFGVRGQDHQHGGLHRAKRPNPFLNRAQQPCEHVGFHHLSNDDHVLRKGLPRRKRSCATRCRQQLPSSNHHRHRRCLQHRWLFRTLVRFFEEAVFVDFADITLSWGRSILAHELEHLLHNALDPYENLWIDEGNADVAIYLCFGADST